MRVEIIPGCISCGACVSINSDIFELNGIVHINQAKVAGHEEDCRAAADACPVNVIRLLD